MAEIENVVQVSQLCKFYGGKRIAAVDNISFDVKMGELFGVIGADGAGKTTLFGMLTSLVRPDSGQLKILGLDVAKQGREIRKMIGYMPGRFSLYPDLTVAENLGIFADLYETSTDSNYHVIEVVYSALLPFKNRRTAQLSGGMKQKLALCCALIHNPQVLFLDEPTTGVDPVSRREFWTVLQSLTATGKTIIISTPYMDEAILCDRIALMQKGRVLAIDTPKAMVSTFTDLLYQIKADQKYPLLTALSNYENIASFYPFGEYIHVTFNAPVNSPHLLGYLTEKGLTNLVFELVKPGIEDVFLKFLTAAV